LEALAEAAVERHVLGGGDSRMWFSSSKPPSRGAIREQLEKLRRQNRKGTMEQAAQRMEQDRHAVRRVPVAEGGAAGLDYAHMIADGQG
jgi:hypothetical protein